MTFPSREFSEQYISSSYQDVLQKYVSGSNLYILDALGNVVFSMIASSIGDSVVASRYTETEGRRIFVDSNGTKIVDE